MVLFYRIELSEYFGVYWFFVIFGEINNLNPMIYKPEIQAYKLTFLVFIIKMQWSNGSTEDHVNRIKCIKRQMYGSAGFEL